MKLVSQSVVENVGVHPDQMTHKRSLALNQQLQWSA